MRRERIVSLGCRLNRYESAVMARHLAAGEGADVRVVHSCAVTAEAARQSRQAARRLRREHPEAVVVATGCAAQIAPGEFAAMPEVDVVLGNREKLEAGAFVGLERRVEGGDALVRVGDIMRDPPEFAGDSLSENLPLRQAAHPHSRPFGGVAPRGSALSEKLPLRQAVGSEGEGARGGVVSQQPPLRQAALRQAVGSEGEGARSGVVSRNLPSPQAASLPKPERVRAFLQVQNGCDHRCTFCVIPFGRGNSRSRSPEDVAQEAQALAAEGFAEITLTGVDLTAYGADLSPRLRLGDLLAHLLANAPQVSRWRLSSLDVAEMDARLLDLLGYEERLLPHAHLSLQSGDDMILKRMKRRHSRGEAIAVCEALRRRRSDIAFGADMIAGFPTESEAMFRRSESLVGECGLTWLHVFAYSPRPGTPAARMPQVESGVARERAARLRARGAEAAQAFVEGLVGTEQEVLMEGEGRGRAGCYALARVRGEGVVGSVRVMRVEAAEGGELHGALLGGRQ